MSNVSSEVQTDDEQGEDDNDDGRLCCGNGDVSVERSWVSFDALDDGRVDGDDADDSLLSSADKCSKVLDDFEFGDGSGSVIDVDSKSGERQCLSENVHMNDSETFRVIAFSNRLVA